MTLEELSYNQVISDYIYKNKETIPIINVVKVTKDVWNRLDIIIFEYCDGNMFFLPMLMDFNKIENPFNVPVGTLINIPDYQYVIQALEITEIFNDKIPGVSNSMSCINQNIENRIAFGNDGNSVTKNKTVAIPKLNIALKKVSYDATTGIISY